MKKLKVDRFEGTFTICVDTEQKKEPKFYAIETSDFSQKPEVGTEFHITDDGEIIIDK
ncbi:MAG: DUF3006 domain-containing protein [Clostridia bacterium]|nr:DUF3006 domain-containing protein [Clostridia bacterium]